MFFETFLIVFLTYIQCSRVLDGRDQKGIYISDYCPKMKYCTAGAHVMCMNYDPKNVMGPRCRDPKNVTITSVLANKLLDVINGLRSKLAYGLEKGKNGNYLPRGYGIFRLRWDNELATFAQVLANQCLLRNDYCRATKKFPNPGQLMGVVRFKGNDWVPASTSPGKKFGKKGLNEEKLIYAITRSLKSWYAQKSQVDIHMVTNYPDWSKNPAQQTGRLYLTMIYGSATHMGCGISAHADFMYYGSFNSEHYNRLLVICNFSAQPRLNAGVYNTVPPTDTDSSFNACGCPIGTLQDDDCLCLEIPRDLEPDMTQKNKPCPPGMNCDPTVVLLPIFSVEDAPPDKLVTAERFANTSIGRIVPGTEPIIDSFEEMFGKNFFEDQSLRKKHANTHGNSDRKKQRKNNNSNSNAVTVYNHHYNKPNEEKKQDSNYHRNKKQHKDLQGHIQASQYRRSSIFSRAPIFELPETHSLLSSTKRDVIPRKDFSEGKKLVDKYLHRKDRQTFKKSNENNLNSLNEVESVDTETVINDYMKLKEHNENIHQHEEVHFHDILTTESILNTAEQNIIDYKDSKEWNLPQNADILDNTTITNENDKKLMALLDTLEQEVKHIDLRDKEKQIFNTKIKRIYDIIVRNLTTISEKSNLGHLKKIKHHANVPKRYDVHNINTENYQTYPKTDVTDVKPNEMERPMVKNQKPLSKKYGRDKYSRQIRNYRPRHNNHLSSLELLRRRYDNELKRRKTYKNNLGKLKHRSNSLDYKKNRNYYSNDPYKDVLSNERRNYYQNKLDNMERKLQDTKYYNRVKDTERSPHMRAVKPSIRSDNQMNSLYSGRARILHGY